MLDKNIRTEYLEPRIWRNLGKVLDWLLPPVRVLHILDEGEKPRAVNDQGERVPVEREDFSNGWLMLEKYPWAEEIRIYTWKGLDRYDRIIQEDSVYEQDMDSYLEFLYEKLEATEGIRVYARHSRTKHVFALLKEWIREDGIYLFWVNERKQLLFNCILVVEGGRLVRLTTSGRYPHIMEDVDQVTEALEKEFGASVHRVIMDDEQRNA